MEILYEDNHLLVINKRPNWIVQGASPDQASLLEWGKSYLKDKYQKPGNVFLGVVSRLDAGVTGAVPFARTSKCASRISEQIRDHKVDKRYWALIEGRPPLEADRLTHWLSRSESETVTRVHRHAKPGALLAELEYKILYECSLTSGASGRPNPGSIKNATLLEIRLITGRKHQIRAQLKEIGTPIVGDKKYGSSFGFAQGIGLHCRRLQFLHPTQGTPLDILANPPEYWPAIKTS